MSSCGDFQFGHGSIQLAKVRTGAGGHDGQFNLAGCVEVVGFLGTCDVEGAVGTSQAPLAVGHDGQVHVGAADPAVGAEFPQGFAVVARGVGGQAHGFADG